MARVLRKIRYLTGRGTRLILLAAWAVLLSPLTLPAQLLRSANPKLALRLAERAERRNPYTPGLLLLLLRLHLQVGNTTAAAIAAQAHMRMSSRVHPLARTAWSEYLDTEPNWTAEISLPVAAPTGAELDLTRIALSEVVPEKIALAASTTDGYAKHFAASIPSLVVVDRSDLRQLLIADALHRWNGTKVRLAGVSHTGHSTEHATRTAVKSARIIAKLEAQ